MSDNENEHEDHGKDRLPGSMAERLIHEKVQQQRRLLEQQQQEQKQQELFRLQQAAFIEKQREEHEKQQKLLRLQREALMQKEEEKLKRPGGMGAHSGTVPVPGTPGVKSSMVVPPNPNFGGPPLRPPNKPMPHSMPNQPPMMSGPPGPRGMAGPPPRPPNNSSNMPPGPPNQRPPGMRGQGPMGRGQSDRQGGPRDSPSNQSNNSRNDKPPPLMSLNVGPPKDEGPKEVKLPQALEQALAFKKERAKQVGVSPEDVEKVEREGLTSMDELTTLLNSVKSSMIKGGNIMKSQYDDDEDDDETTKNTDEDKGKRKKKKKKKSRKKHDDFHQVEVPKKKESKSKKAVEKEPEIEVNYIGETVELDYSDPNAKYFAKVFEKFRIEEPEVPPPEPKAEVKPEAPPENLSKAPKNLEKDSDDSDDSDDDKKDDDKPKISKRKLKLLKRMSIAELKQTVSRPDVVEMHDVTAKDPKLLVSLKATRNTVPVPRHWCFKRKYLQGKRGIEKPPFDLPEFIKKTGIMELRAALQEKEDQKTLKAKMRDKVRPKMGKIDIDYQKLHDAFFKWQTKPKMTIHGDLYYEGKEYETKMKDKKPGEMSEDLRIALGMPVSSNAHKVPPPWLIAMQRYGPPPSYPNLKIPGLNSPIPEGCNFGYHAGGWGKPPVDNMGKPIYGDVFGTSNKDYDAPMVEEEIERTMWGELESESEEESEEEEESDEEDNTGMVTPGDTGLVTPSGISSLPAGLETPDMIELRKKRMETEMEGGDTPALYAVLPEKRIDQGIGRSMMGSTHTYDMTAAAAAPAKPGARGVEMALDPSELDLVDTDAIAARYEQSLREQQNGGEEDFSDMVAEHAAKQRNKRRKQQQDQSKPTKKYKDFKF